MRPANTLAGILALLLMNASLASAEHVLRGYYIDNLPACATSKELAADKSIVLAHVMNCDNTDLEAGKYQIGIELDGSNGQRKTFIISPKENIFAGTIKTFRLAVSKADVDVQNGSFKVFTKINDEIKWSESFSYKPKFSDSSSNKSITLYAEAPEMGEQEPANSNALPVINENENLNSNSNDTVEMLRQKLAQVESEKNGKAVNNNIQKSIDKTEEKISSAVEASFEMANATNTTASNVVNKTKNEVKQAGNDVKTQVSTTVAKVDEKISKNVKNQTEKVNNGVQKAGANSQKIAKNTADNAKKQVDAVKEEIVVEKPRNIDPNEFKKLKTIDEELIIYVIKEGDTLKSIAQKYYGKASKERVIADLNFIEKTSSIKVGEEIIVDVRPLSKSKNG